MRAIEAYVCALDLAALGFQHAEGGGAGQPAYDPADLLKLYLYGYLNQVRSSRRLEREAGRNVELIWLLRGKSAWRVMFGIGALPAFLIFFIRRSVEEPALSVISRQTEKRSSIAEIFSSANIRATVSGSLLTIGAQGGFYALMTWVPQYLRSERKISILASTPYLLALISGCFLGYLTGGWLSDKFGRRPVFLFFSALAAGAVYAYTHLPLTDTQMLILGFPLGFFATGYYSALMACLNELFPTRVRGAGVGFTYNAGRAIGGTFPFLVGALAATTTLSSAISVFALISYGIVFVTALFLLRETKGAAL